MNRDDLRPDPRSSMLWPVAFLLVVIGVASSLILTMALR